ncbi:MAG: ATP-binding protein [Vulcanimicrobiota bacterium]
MRTRYLETAILRDLQEKMVFLGGPRQIGKTTMAENIAKKHFERWQYLNWDHADDRQDILKGRLLGDAQLVIFDEIHKYGDWKNLIKGLYDKYRSQYRFLVTGSARLDIYRKGGDSLLGRYHYYRLHPFSLSESLGNTHVINAGGELNFSMYANESYETYMHLLHFGGFPEPFIRKSERTLRRWQNSRVEQIVREDIRDLSNLRDISAIQVLVNLLPARVGSLLSLNSLREDLKVAHKTVAHWLEILESLYFAFRIHPYARDLAKSLKKEPKLYLWDWSCVRDEPARLENMVASHLQKFCHFLKDSEGFRTDLSYLRDREGREVDFLITLDGAPWCAIEVKSEFSKVSRSLRYFGERLPIPFLYQVVNTKGIDLREGSVRVLSVDRFLSSLR